MHFFSKFITNLTEDSALLQPEPFPTLFTNTWPWAYPWYTPYQI